MMRVHRFFTKIRIKEGAKIMFRKLTCTLLAINVLFGMLVTASPKSEASGETPDSLKILCIGNSFNQDTMAYLPPVLREILPDTELTVGVLHTSSATIGDHIRWNDEDKKYHIFDYWGPESDAWSRLPGRKSKSLKEALALADWDIITMQGVSSDVLSDAGIEQMTADAERLSEWLRRSAQKPFALMWFEWIGRPEGNLSADQMAVKVRDAAVYAEKKLDIDAVIPVGDAFQIARGYESLRTIGSAPYGNLLYEDNVHMQAGLPALLASYTTAAAILRYYGMDVRYIERSSWVPNNDNVLAINANNEEGKSFTHGFPYGVTAENVALAKVIAADSVINFDKDQAATAVISD